MSNEHTPGPWRATAGVNQMSDMGTTIWHSGPTVPQPCGVYSDAEIRRDSLADANLISAAPDLLEALQALVQANEDWNSAVAGIMGRPANWTDGYLDAARSAIAKAKGLKQ